MTCNDKDHGRSRRPSRNVYDRIAHLETAHDV
jgi:hypothetical protein